MRAKKNILSILSILLLSIFVGCSNSKVKSFNINKTTKILKQNTNSIIINVDTPIEYSMSHIEGDINIDILSIGFMDKISKLEKTNKYFIYSKIKSRAISAASIMNSKEFIDVSVIDGEYTNIINSVILK